MQKCLLSDKDKDRNLEPAKKKIKTEKAALNYKIMDHLNKNALVEINAKKYKSMDPIEKSVLLETNAQKYKSMEPNPKEVCLMKNRTNMKNKYEAMDAIKKAKHLERCQQAHRKPRTAKNNPMLLDLDDYISTFKNKIKEGPYYVCSVCNRLLYRKSVVLLQKHKYNNINENMFTDIKSFDHKEYICKTCHSKVLKDKIPCQAICNNMYVDEIPAELSSLEKLECQKDNKGKSREPFAMCLLNVMRHVKFYHAHLKDQV